MLPPPSVSITSTLSPIFVRFVRAHFAFWTKNILEHTAQVINSVLQLRPCPISFSIGWMGEHLGPQGLQLLYIPAQVVLQKKAGGMTLCKRKAAASNNATATQALGVVADNEPENPCKHVRMTRASQKAKFALELTATPAPAALEDTDKEQAS